MNPATDHVVSTVLTTAQACGALLVAVVLAYLARLHRTPHAQTWAVGFAALAVALGAVRAFIAFSGRGWWALYLVAEWTFGVCLAAGSREFAGTGRLAPRRFLAALPLRRARRAPDRPAPVRLQRALRRPGRRRVGAVGVRLPRARRRAPGATGPSDGTSSGSPSPRSRGSSSSGSRSTAERCLYLGAWAAFSPLADLVAETLLGIGVILVLSEDLTRRLAEAVREIRALARRGRGRRAPRPAHGSLQSRGLPRPHRAERRDPDPTEAPS